MAAAVDGVVVRDAVGDAVAFENVLLLRFECILVFVRGVSPVRVPMWMSVGESVVDHAWGVLLSVGPRGRRRRKQLPRIEVG